MFLVFRETHFFSWLSVSRSYYYVCTVTVFLALPASLISPPLLFRNSWRMRGFFFLWRGEQKRILITSSSTPFRVLPWSMAPLASSSSSSLARLLIFDAAAVVFVRVASSMHGVYVCVCLRVVVFIFTTSQHPCVLVYTLNILLPTYIHAQPLAPEIKPAGDRVHSGGAQLFYHVTSYIATVVRTYMYVAMETSKSSSIFSRDLYSSC